jgi:hypothetical protein
VQLLPATEARYTWTLPGVAKIYREEGFGALYKGYVPKVLRLGPGGGILLVVFDYGEQKKKKKRRCRVFLSFGTQGHPRNPRLTKRFCIADSSPELYSQEPHVIVSIKHAILGFFFCFPWKHRKPALDGQITSMTVAGGWHSARVLKREVP